MVKNVFIIFEVVTFKQKNVIIFIVILRLQSEDRYAAMS